MASYTYLTYLDTIIVWVRGRSKIRTNMNLDVNNIYFPQKITHNAQLVDSSRIYGTCIDAIQGQGVLLHSSSLSA